MKDTLRSPTRFRYLSRSYILEEHGTIQSPFTEEMKFALAAGMFSTLNSNDAAVLIDSFRSSTKLQYLNYNNMTPPQRISPSQFFSRFSNGDFSEGGFSPPRFHYYWMGTSRRPYGYFSRSYRTHQELIEGIRHLEQSYFVQGLESPFTEVISSSEKMLVSNRVKQISQALSGNYKLENEWGKVMKTLYEGVTEALIELKEQSGGIDIPRILYAHGIEGELPQNDEDLDLEVPSPSESKMKLELGDLVILNDIRTRVQEIKEQGNSLVIRLSIMQH